MKHPMDLKKGERVRVVKGDRFVAHMIGKVGVIEEVYRDAKWPYLVRCDLDSFFFNEDELEKVE